MGFDQRHSTGAFAEPLVRTARRQSRVAHRVPCVVRVDGEARFLRGETVNLSADGLALVLGESVPVGTPLHVRIEGTAGIRGGVVRTRRVSAGTFEVGIAFEQRAYRSESPQAVVR
jgi:hypothetical protein